MNNMTNKIREMYTAKELNRESITRNWVQGENNKRKNTQGLINTVKEPKSVKQKIHARHNRIRYN